MTENPKEKKGVFAKIKENIDDKEEQIAFISVIVRLVVLGWSAFIVSLNYISIPGYSNEPKDITFPGFDPDCCDFHISGLRHHVKKEKNLKIQKINLVQCPLRYYVSNRLQLK